MDENKAAKIAAAKAKHEAAVALEKAQMEANIAKMRAKKPLTDAEAQKMKSSITGEKPEAPSAPKENLRSKRQSRAARATPETANTVAARPVQAAPALPGTQASAFPELPNRPLPGQGSMEGKPVEKVLVKTNPNLVSEEGVKKWKADVDAERRITQGAAPEAERRAALQAQKVMTPSGVVEPTVPKASADPFAEMRAAGRRGFGAVQAQVDDSVRAAYQASTRLGNRAAHSLARRAGTAVGKGVRWAGTTGGKAAIDIAKHILVKPFEPAVEFAQGGAARQAAWEAASPTGKVFQAGKTLATGAWAGARTAGRVGWTIGEGLAMEGAWSGGREAARQTEAVVADTKRKRAHNIQFGLRVSAPEYNETLFRAFAGGSPKLKVHDTTQDIGPDGKSLSQKRREKGQAIFEYNQAKAKAGRDVIKGSSK